MALEVLGFANDPVDSSVALPAVSAVRKRFLELSRLTHPDKNLHRDAQAEEVRNVPLTPFQNANKQGTVLHKDNSKCMMQAFAGLKAAYSLLLRWVATTKDEKSAPLDGHLADVSKITIRNSPLRLVMDVSLPPQSPPLISTFSSSKIF